MTNFTELHHHLHQANIIVHKAQQEEQKRTWNEEDYSTEIEELKAEIKVLKEQRDAAKFVLNSQEQRRQHDVQNDFSEVVDVLRSIQDAWLLLPADRNAISECIRKYNLNYPIEF